MRDSTDGSMTEPSSGGLFDAFPPIDTETWEACIASDLGTRSREDVLLWTPEDDLTIRAYYREEDLEDVPHLAREAPVSSDTSTNGEQAPQITSGWQIRQDVVVRRGDGIDLDDVQEQIAEAVQGGVDMIGLRLPPSAPPRSIPTGDELRSLARRVPLTGIGIHLQAGPNTLSLVDAFRNAGIHVREMTAGFDVVGERACSGAFGDGLAQVAEAMRTEGADRILCADAAPYHNRGAGLITETAFMLAAFTEYLVRLSRHDVDPAQTLDRIHVSLPIGPSYFLEVARLRAVRLLIGLILRTVDERLSVEHVPIHAVTSRRNMTRYDPHTNLLRATTEAASAVVGGCDVLAIRPFDALDRDASPHGRRIARNLHHLMRHEAHLDKVADPAAGSYYVEVLTDAIARRTWALFKQVEDHGGLIEAASSGFVAAHLNHEATALLQGMAVRRRTLVGTNKYPNPAERHAGTELDDARAGTSTAHSGGEGDADDAADRAMHAPLGADDSRIPVGPFRAAEPFESIRIRTERFGVRRGRPASAVVLPVGDARRRKRRAEWAADILRCAGFHADVAEGADVIGQAPSWNGSTTDVLVIANGDARFEPNALHEVDAFIGYDAICLASSSRATANVDVQLFPGANLVYVFSRLQAILEMEDPS